MTKLQINTEAQARRREAVARARAIVGFAGKESTPEMQALMERHISGELTLDEVIAQRSRLVR